jgi:hypothetical protein
MADLNAVNEMQSSQKYYCFTLFCSFKLFLITGNFNLIFLVTLLLPNLQL